MLATERLFSRALIRATTSRRSAPTTRELDGPPVRDDRAKLLRSVTTEGSLKFHLGLQATAPSASYAEVLGWDYVFAGWRSATIVDRTTARLARGRNLLLRVVPGAAAGEPIKAPATRQTTLPRHGWHWPIPLAGMPRRRGIFRPRASHANAATIHITFTVLSAHSVSLW